MLTITNKATVNIFAQFFFFSLGYLLRSRIARSCGSILFTFIRKYCTVFQNSVPFYIPTLNIGKF